MEAVRCTQCDKTFGDEFEHCPHCGAVSPKIPNYPRFGGGAFMTMWIFFVILIIVFLVSWYAN